MSKYKAIKELEKLESYNDAEYIHSQADEILLKALESAGVGEVSEAYRKLREDKFSAYYS